MTAIKQSRIEVLRNAITKVTKILANRNLEVTQQGSEAYVEACAKTGQPKRVNLPYISESASDDLLRAVQGFLDHEVAHILFTDHKELAKSEAKHRVYKEFHNLVEDTFVERKMSETLKGSKYNLNSLSEFHISKVIDKNFNELPDDAPALQKFSALSPSIVRAWAGNEEHAAYMDDKWPLIEEITDKFPQEMIDQIKSVSSSAEAGELAERIVKAALGEPPEEPPKPNDDDSGENEDGGGGEGDDKKDSSDGGGENEDESENEDQSESDGKSDKSDDSSDENSGNDSDGDPDEGDDDEEGDSGDGDDDDEEGDDEEGDSGNSGGDDDDEEGGDDEKDDSDSDGDDDSDSDGDGNEDANEKEDDADEDAGSEDDPDEKDEIEWMPSDSQLNDLANPGDNDLTQAVNELVQGETKTKGYKAYSTDYDLVYTAEECDPNNNLNYVQNMVVEMEEETRALGGVAAKELQRAFIAENKSHWQPGLKKGRVNPASLSRLKVGDDRVFRKKIETKAKNTSVMIVNDLSGSMGGTKLINAMKTSFLLAETMDKLKIPFSSMGFTTCSYKSTELFRERFDIDISAWLRDATESICDKNEYNVWARVNPLVIPVFKTFDEPFSPAVKRRMANAKDYRYKACNIDGESIRRAAVELSARQEPQKVMIVLSDGAPVVGHGIGEVRQQTSYLKSVVEEIEASGIKVIGIGLNSDAVKDFYSKSIVMREMSDLPERVLRELKELILS